MNILDNKQESKTTPHFSLKMELFLSSASKKQSIFIVSCQATTGKKKKKKPISLMPSHVLLDGIIYLPSLLSRSYQCLLPGFHIFVDSQYRYDDI